ncbi:hypothetical protein niasHS_014333 [Heterodera schachtii]|uniref:Uncharacterized protein n=2 Tax=Heterodera TaxID=34509 RepID=A0ABD2IFD9_HETSC
MGTGGRADQASAKDFQCIVFTNFIHNFEKCQPHEFCCDCHRHSHSPNGAAQGLVTTQRFLRRLYPFATDGCFCFGTYRVMMYGLLASVCSAFLYALSASPLVIILFMVLDSVIVHAIAPLNPVSSLVFSLNALFTKPAISIAPVVIVYLLNQNGYELYRSKGHIFDQLRVCMARVPFVIPLLLGTVELLAFRHYSLRHKHRPTSALPI